ncbi:hypothetical protein EYC80_009067 [Monilinia laxa]|uniref:Uncharacterized protein n=1 Tax=Monilinia laxa TaxID=61186 RepID=A0A5N6K2D7_MONLA|nr:hypothetical protein EYC80_009067 [Monilinia laxa]
MGFKLVGFIFDIQLACIHIGKAQKCDTSFKVLVLMARGDAGIVGQQGIQREEYDQEAMGLECMFIVWMCQKLREHRDEYERSGGGMRKWPTGSWFYIPSIVKCRQKTDRNNDRK